MALRQVEKQMAIPDRSGDRLERVILQPEIGDTLHLRRRDQAACQIVSPGVVRTLNRRCKLPRSLRDQPGSWWRQTLQNARIVPWSSRTTITLSPAISRTT